MKLAGKNLEEINVNFKFIKFSRKHNKLILQPLENKILDNEIFNADVNNKYDGAGIYFTNKKYFGTWIYQAYDNGEWGYVALFMSG